MKCIILAAGYATRMYPLTENFPKPLLIVGRKTILDWLIDDIAETDDVDEFVVVTNHKFAPTFRSWAIQKPLNITVVDDGTTTNEARLGAVLDIKYAIDDLQIHDDLLVMAGDNVLDFSLQPFIKYALVRQTACIMRYHEPSVERLRRTGVLVVDDDDLVLEMQEKPAVPASEWACPPFYFYPKDTLRLLEEGLKSGCGTDAPGNFAKWLSTRVPVHAMLMPGGRYDIGNIETYKAVHAAYKGPTVH